jgi:RNA polymerase sigma factor (sigma-70 family)
MRCGGYSYWVAYAPIRIRETAPVPEYASNHADPLRSWSDEEIARVRIVLRKLTGLRINNEQDAEDLVQETLLTMTRKPPAGELQKGLLVWSMGILRRKVGNYYRRSRRFTSLDAAEPGRRTRPQGARQTVAQESRVHYDELRAIITGVLESFPVPERKVLELALMGLPTCEIAAELSPELYQNVANRLHRGRKKLAKVLARYGYGPKPGIDGKTAGGLIFSEKKSQVAKH